MTLLRESDSGHHSVKTALPDHENSARAGASFHEEGSLRKATEARSTCLHCLTSRFRLDSGGAASANSTVEGAREARFSLAAKAGGAKKRRFEEVTHGEGGPVK